MPIEKEGNFIRARIKDPSGFASFRTITLSGKRGISAVYGKIKGTMDYEIQSYLFSISNWWTMSKVMAWLTANNLKAKMIVGDGSTEIVIDKYYLEEDLIKNEGS